MQVWLKECEIWVCVVGVILRVKVRWRRRNVVGLLWVANGLVSASKGRGDLGGRRKVRRLVDGAGLGRCVSWAVGISRSISSINASFPLLPSVVYQRLANALIPHPIRRPCPPFMHIHLMPMARSLMTTRREFLR